MAGSVAGAGFVFCEICEVAGKEQQLYLLTAPLSSLFSLSSSLLSPLSLEKGSSDFIVREIEFIHSS
jgi:hypothetical protein